MDIIYFYPDVMGYFPIYSQLNASDIMLYIMRNRLKLINISQTKIASPSTSANPDSVSHPQLAVEDEYYLIWWMLLNFQFHALS